MLKPLSVAALGFCALGLALPIGCATVPKTQEGRADLSADAQHALDSLIAKDPSLKRVIDRSTAYAVFPTVGKGGAIVGGAYGKGILYQNGKQTGFVELNQASIGAQLGGQSFSEVIVFQTPAAVERLKSGTLNLTADMSAIAITSGAAASAPFSHGMAVFVEPKGGAMVEVSVGGQKINYVPMG